jgi:hypothetical protein
MILLPSSWEAPRYPSHVTGFVHGAWGGERNQQGGNIQQKRARSVAHLEEGSLRKKQKGFNKRPAPSGTVTGGDVCVSTRPDLQPGITDVAGSAHASNIAKGWNNWKAFHQTASVAGASMRCNEGRPNASQIPRNKPMPRTRVKKRGRVPASKQGGASADEKEICPPLFGTGLLRRIEKQAVERKAVLAESKWQREGPKSLCHHDANAMTQSESRVQPSDKRKRLVSIKPCDESSAYALSDSRIYNFKEAQMHSCFPRKSAQAACQAILDAIGKCNVHDEGKRSEGNVHPGESTHEVSLDHILSSVPYRDMLHDLFGSSDGPGGRSNCGKQQAGSDVPVVAKSYEESFMREPMWSYERHCIMGCNCECNFISPIPGEAFTAVEFVLPSEACLDASERTRQMCVLCHRKMVQSLFYDILYEGKPFHGIIQRYGSMCNHAGKMP